MRTKYAYAIYVNIEFSIEILWNSSNTNYMIIYTFLILGGYTSEPEVTSYSVFAGKPTGINGENG